MKMMETKHKTSKRFDKVFEGQILLSIHQYFPTDYIRMAKKNQGMMNLFIEDISEKLRKGIMDCDLDSSALEINNQANPLFTLTAEEVEVVESVLYGCYHSLMLKSRISSDENIMIEKAANLLTRIKQWQNENSNIE